MKQTAVQYIEEKIKKYPELYFVMSLWFEDAKEMEKQQIIKAWYDCKMSVIEKNPTTADEYYNETFKK